MVNTLHGRTTQHKHNTTRNKNEELIQFYFDVNFIHIHIGDMSCVCALSLAHVSHLKHVLPVSPPNEHLCSYVSVDTLKQNSMFREFSLLKNHKKLLSNFVR